MKGFETGIEKCARIYTQDTGVRVVWGDKCATDGKGTIYLPTLSDSADPKVLNRTRLNMGHEVAHVLHSDFSLVAKAIKDGGQGKRIILNSVEDVRIERLWELEYTGCQEDFREDYKHFVKKEFNTRLTGAESIFSKVLNLLIIRSREKQLGFESGLIVPEKVEKIFQEKLGDLVDHVASLTTMKEVSDCTDVIYKRFKEDPIPEPEPPKSEGKPKKGKGEKSKDSKPKKSESESEKSEEDTDGEESDAEGPGDEPDEGTDSGPESDKADDEPGEGEDGESSDGDGEDGEEDEGESGSSGDGKDSPEEGAPSGGSEEVDSPKPEEDEELTKLKEELKKDMEEDSGVTVATIQDSRVKEINEFAETSDEYLVDPRVVDNIFKPEITMDSNYRAAALMAEGKKTLSFVGQRLQHLFMSKKSRKVIRFLKTGPLDSYRIMEDESDLICKRKLRGRNQDSVVGFSIDKSSSMNSAGKDRLATSLSLATGHFLEQIKVPFMALGLSSPNQGYEVRDAPVDIGILKDFNEPIKKVMGRFTNMRMSQNSDLDGMKLLAKQIMMRPEPKKIIFVFSDGQPVSGGHILNERHMASYIRYIKRLQRAGIIVFGFGIKYHVEHIFGKENSVYVSSSNLNEFPKLVFKQLSKILLE